VSRLNNFRIINRGNEVKPQQNSVNKNQSMAQFSKNEKSHDFNFEAFEEHNNMLNLKKEKEIEKKDFDPEILSKLEEFALEDSIKGEPKIITENKFSVENSEEIDEEFEDGEGVLVHRPVKNFVWGLGLGQKTKQRKCI